MFLSSKRKDPNKSLWRNVLIVAPRASICGLIQKENKILTSSNKGERLSMTIEPKAVDLFNKIDTHGH